MQIKSIKKTTVSTGKGKIKETTTRYIDYAIFTKDDAAKRLKDLYEMTYEFIDDWIIKNDSNIELHNKKEKLKRMRDKIGVLKECEIIIK